MDGILEKFSLYDFFNVIFSGGIFLLGLHVMGIFPLSYVEKKMELPNHDIIMYAVIIFLCYIIGACLQFIGSCLTKNIGFLKFQSGITSSILNDKEIYDNNSCKLAVYKGLADKIFEKKGISVKDGVYTAEQCEYFFAYCSYYIQVHGHNSKTEKMRALKGLDCLWMVCFAALSLVAWGWCVHLRLCDLVDNITVALVCGIIFPVLSIVSYYKMKTNVRYWIKMVLATYEVCSEENGDNK